MSEGRRKVLEMLEAGTITQEDAARLLEALGDEEEAKPESIQPQMPEQSPKPEYEAMNTAQTVMEQAKEAAREGIKMAKDTIQRVKEAIPKLTLHPDDLEVNLDLNLDDLVPPTPPTPLTPPAPPTPPTPPTMSPVQGASVFCDGLELLEINWLSGPVELNVWPNDYVQITEYPSRPLKPDEKLFFYYEDGELRIKWSAQLGARNTLFQNLSKRLVVDLPQAWENLEQVQIKNAAGDVLIKDLPMSFEDLEISTASGNVELKNLHGEDIKVTTASGKLSAAEVQGESVEFSTASGKLYLDGVQGEELTGRTASGAITANALNVESLKLNSASGNLEVNGFCAEDDAALNTVSGKLTAYGQGNELKVGTVSGALSLTLAEMPEEVKLNTVSGKIELTLPEDTGDGFNVRYTSNSGAFQSDFPLTGKLERKKGDASFGDGETEISMSTVSGNMMIKKA